MADLVVKATLRDNVLPQLAKIAAGVQALEKQMDASSKRMQASQDRHAKRTDANLLKIDDSMRHTARRMASRIILIGAAIAAAAGHAVAFTGALWPMIGALGAIPAVAVGGIAGIAALIVGFSGLGAAMKKAGGGSSQSADQIANAQRRIEMANRSLRDSQEALNDAWETARDRLRDIQTAYAGSKLDVEAAALAVKEAELALRRARASGDRQERARADLALRQAQLALIEAQNRAVDVEQEYQELMAQGVEGSEEVRDATERQADALYELAQAQKALADAQRGGGGASAQAEAYAKLSAAGKALVDTFKSLGPEWRKVQQATQQSLLTGVAEDVRRLSGSYLPVMLRQLPALAGGWNTLIRSMSGVSTQAGFVKDMDDSLGLMAIMWQRVGRSFGPFLSGFRHWVAIGADFMPRMGSWIERQAQRWELWSLRVRESGKGFRWIDNALVTGHKFNELIKSWGRSLFEVFRLGQDRTLIDNLVAGSLAFEHWLNTAQGQERITLMWERMREIGSAAWVVIKELIDILSQADFSAIATVLNTLGDALGFVSDNMSWLNGLIGPLILGMVAAKIASKGAEFALKGFGGAAALAGLQVGSTTKALAGLAGPLALVSTLAWEAGTAQARWADEQGGWLKTATVLFGGLAQHAYFWRQQSEMAGIARYEMDGLATSVQATSDEYERASRELQTWSDLLRAQAEPLFAFNKAQDRLTEAQRRYNDAVARYGADSPQAIQALQDQAQAELDLIEATSRLATVNGPELTKWLEEMVRTGNLSRESADLLLQTLNKIPGAIAKVDGSRIRLYFDGQTTRIDKGGNQPSGSPIYFHDGGVVPGRRGEEVAAVLQAGETVLPLDHPRSAAAAAGPTSVHVSFDFTGIADELGQAFVNFLRKRIRIQAGKSAERFFAAPVT